MDACDLANKIYAWVLAQPNADEIKAWVLSEHGRRVEWQDELGTFSARALGIEHDVEDALWYMSGLGQPCLHTDVIGRERLRKPSEFTPYGAAFMDLIVRLRREPKNDPQLR